MTTNQGLFDRATRVIPGGVNSPVRAFDAVGGTPYFVARADGAWVWDVEGTAYLDLVQSYGAVIAGHAHPLVVAAIQLAATLGTSYGAPTEREVLLAEEISARMPSCEMVRLVSSGTEATMTALRLARGFTGRDRVVKFAGNYHGHGDALLVDSGSAVAHVGSEAGVPGSAGVPADAVAATTVVPFNVVPTLDDSVAAVIVEPVAANMGLVAPVPGFLDGLRAECDRVGALLIFDEVITGFRLLYGGAQALLRVKPDLTCLGKVIGGGLPVGAYGGHRSIMKWVAPEGPVYQAGTLSGNPLAVSAGIAALGALKKEGVYAKLAAMTASLVVGLKKAAGDAGVPVRINSIGSMFTVFFTETDVRDFQTAKTSDTERYARFFHAMLRRGVYFPPSQFETGFLSLAHTKSDIKATIELAREAFGEVAG